MSPRDAAEIRVSADQVWRSADPAEIAHGRHMSEWSRLHQRAQGAKPVGFDSFTGPGVGDLAPAAAEDVPPPLVDIGLNRELSGSDDEQQQQQQQEAHKSFLVADADTDTAAATAAAAISNIDVAAAADVGPAQSSYLVIAAAKDPNAMDSGTVALDSLARDCSYGGSGGDAATAPAAAAADLAAAASTAAAVLKRLASYGGSSPGVAGALEQAAQRLTSAFTGAAATSDASGAAGALSHGGGEVACARGAGSCSSSGSDVSGRAPLLTQTASGRVAKVPSASLDLRPHTGRPEGAQRLLAAALASVGSLARAASYTTARRTAGEGEEGEGEAALTSAATALELAMAEINGAAADVARTTSAEQEGPGLYGTGAEEFPAASPGKVYPPQAIAPGRNPATVAAVYGNVQRTYAAVIAPPQPPSATTTSHGDEGRQDELYGNDEETSPVSVAVSCEAGGVDVDNIPYADVTDRVPAGYQLVLNATTAVIAPVAAQSDASAGGAEDVDDIGRIGSPGAYVYDRPDAPPPGVKPAAAVSGFAGAADWAWEDPEMDSPPAPADGGLVPDSVTAIHDAEVAAAAAAMPSIIRDADDPATSPPGAAATALYVNRTSFAQAATSGNVGHGAAVTIADPAATAARLPPVPADLDAAAREALGPYGHERTAAATAAAVATIAPPRYVTLLPPRLLDILREPSARDLAGV